MLVLEDVSAGLPRAKEGPIGALCVPTILYGFGGTGASSSLPVLFLLQCLQQFPHIYLRLP